MKLVSVVMCTYNGDQFLREQLDSILNQTYPLYEIIIRDDCSIDTTWNILQTYQAKYPILFKCYQNDINMGYGSNFKRALLQAQGEFIVFSDQDDIWMTDKVEVMLNVIGDSFLVLSNSKIVDTENNTTSNLFEESCIQNNSIEKLIWNNNVYGHSCLISAKLQPYIERIHVNTAHDYLIALICYSLGSYVTTEKQLQIWRRHNKAKTFVDTRGTRKYSGNYKIVYSIWSLLFRRKSTVIEDGFDKINTILRQFSEKKLISKNHVDLVLLTKLLKKQTICSYLMASLLCWKLRHEMFANEIKGLKSKVSILTFVFRWWYDHQYDMS